MCPLIHLFNSWPQANKLVNHGNKFLICFHDILFFPHVTWRALYICNVCLFTGVYKSVLCEHTGMPLYMSVWRFLWTEKLFLIITHTHTHTHSSHASVIYELHKYVQGLILTKLLLIINLSYAKLWLMAAGFWWGCRCLDGMTVRLSPSVWFQACVCYAGKIPGNKTPPPVFLPPCQPKRDKNAQHSHTQTYQH